MVTIIPEDGVVESSKGRTRAHKLKKKWWRIDPKMEEGEKKIADGIFEAVLAQKAVQDQRLEDAKKHLQAYTNRSYQALTLAEFRAEMLLFDRGRLTSEGRKITMSSNPSKSALDTVASTVTDDRVKPNFVTSGADWDLYRQAKKLDQFTEAEFERWGLYDDTGEQIFYDAGIFDLGCGKVWGDGKPQCARIFPLDIIVNEAACLHSAPRTLYERKFVGVETLLARFPEKEEEILESIGELTEEDEVGESLVEEDIVEVIEAFHLHVRSKDGKKLYGRRVVAVAKGVLELEVWNHDWMPYFFLRFNLPSVGFYGMGLIEELHDAQEEFNKHLQRIADNIGIHGNARTWAEKGSIVDKSKLRNFERDICEYNVGTQAPKTSFPPSMPSDAFKWARWIRGSMFEDIGISPLAASGRIEPGLESGRAIRTALDREAQRLSRYTKRFRGMFVEAAKLFVNVARELYKDAKKPDYRVFYGKGDWVRTINWSQVADLKEAQYQLKIYPTNLLSTHPASRYDRVTEGFKVGIFNRMEVHRLLDAPDIQRYSSLALAAHDDIEEMTERMIEDGSYLAPEKHQDLQLGITHVTSSLLRAKMHGAPDDVLDNLRDWLDAAYKLLKDEQVAEMQEQLQMQQMMAGPQELGGGGAPEGQPAQAPPAM